MQYTMHNLARPSSHKRSKKRVGRGNASGKGTYSARGLKGQKARSGGRRGLKRRAAFQQLLMRTPKLRGFKRQSPEIATINLASLNKHFSDGDVVDVKSLVKKRLIRRVPGGVKVLGNGTIEKKLIVNAHAFSAAAQDAITKAGGTCVRV